MPARLAGHLVAAACLAAGLGAAGGFGYGNGPGWLLPTLGLAVLWLAVVDVSPRLAAWYGWLFGLGLYGLGLNWTHTSLHTFGNLPLAGALALATTLAALLALFPALTCWLARRLAGDGAVRNLAAGAALWALTEHVRSWLFSGFGWLALGYAQVPHGPLAGFVPVLGTFGATALGAAVSAMLALAVLAHPDRRAATLPAALAATVLLIGLPLKQVHHTRPIGDPVAVSVLQGAIPQHDLWMAENLGRIPRIYLDLMARARGQLVVAPESALPFKWANYPAGGRAEFHTMLADRDAALVIGSFTADPVSGRSHNAALILHDGETQSYAKRHLAPYGEYLPFADVLEPVLERAAIPYAQLEPGRGDGTVPLPFATLGIGICFESLFPALIAAPPAELLVNITNDSWFDGSAMPRQHLQIAAARALEHGRWLVRASNTGPSAVIGPDGTVRRFVAHGVRGIAEHQVTRRTGATPYARWGDWPVLLVALAVLLGCRWRRQS